MKDQKRVEKISISQALERAEIVWAKCSKLSSTLMPFKTKKAYLKWVKESCEYMNSLSAKDREDYFRSKQVEIYSALQHIEKLSDKKNQNK
jgi:hypothetical protein